MSADALTRIADDIDASAVTSSRPGQMAALERIAERVRAERDRLHSWAGLMALLDEHYPDDVFTGRSGDRESQIIALIRKVHQLREAESD